MKTKLSDKEIQHLYWRAGFGITNPELSSIRKLSKEKIIHRLFENSKPINELNIDFSEIENYSKDATAEEKREKRKLQREKIKELNILWNRQLHTTEAVLREKMTLFFTNHFSVRIVNIKGVLQLHNIIRKNALGNFGDLLMQVSKSPAMITFLNNQQNKKKSPNENFAREVMELFTLGRDNGYTEKDIKEAARAFTGWGVHKKVEFVFRKNVHDYETKTILGQTGNFTGEDVIKILLSKQQTAKYITQKIYKYLVNDELDEANVNELTQIFYNSGYNISILLKAIFRSDNFYESKNIGVLIKSPIDLITGLSRQFKIVFNKPKTLMFLQNKLNQTIFNPPNVAGWPGGKYWIDSSTLMLRIKLASMALNGGVITEDFTGDSMMMQKKKRKAAWLSKNNKVTADWDLFLSSLETENKEKIASFLIQPRLSSTAQKIIKDAEYLSVKSYVVKLLSLPEYQLC